MAQPFPPAAQVQQLTDVPVRPPPLASRGWAQRCLSYLGPIFFMSDGEFVETVGLDGLVSRGWRQSVRSMPSLCRAGWHAATWCGMPCHGAVHLTACSTHTPQPP